LKTLGYTAYPKFQEVPPSSTLEKKNLIFALFFNSPYSKITPNSSTLIDVILSNEPSRILKSGVVHIGVSDHSMVFAVRKFAIPSKNTHKHVTTRSFKNFNANAFREDLKSAPWDSLRNCTTPDEMVEIWKNMFLKIADAHAPRRTRRVRNKTPLGLLLS